MRAASGAGLNSASQERKSPRDTYVRTNGPAGGRRRTAALCGEGRRFIRQSKYDGMLEQITKIKVHKRVAGRCYAITREED